MGRRSSVVRERRNSNPKTLGSIPWRGEGERQFFYPSEATLVQICLCLTPLRVYGTLAAVLGFCVSIPPAVRPTLLQQMYMRYL